MPEGHADVADDSTVGEVALQTADGQLLCQEGEDGVGHAEVAFRVLVVDGVDFVRHSAAAHLAGLDLLLEIVHRDVHPEVAVEVDDDSIDATQSIEKGGQMVVV